jgi:hypothetical protein
MLTVLPVTLPRSLEGVQNGRLPAHLLEQVGLRGFLHPNAARCWRALCAEGATKGFHLTYTFGGCYRSYAQQRDLFVSRYQTEPIAGRPTKVWEGVVYYQKPRTAMAAAPGTSNHGLGLAVDAALDNDLSDGVGPDDAVSISPALPWFREAALRYGFSFEAQSEPWHIRLVCGDRMPAAVVAYEDSLKPPLPPPVPPVPSLEVTKMLTIVGNDDNRDDPRRWVFDGGTSMRLLPNEEAYAKLLAYERVGMVKLYPFFSTLASPHWMSTADRAQYGCA